MAVNTTSRVFQQRFNVSAQWRYNAQFRSAATARYRQLLARWPHAFIRGAHIFIYFALMGLPPRCDVTSLASLHFTRRAGHADTMVRAAARAEITSRRPPRLMLSWRARGVNTARYSVPPRRCLARSASPRRRCRSADDVSLSRRRPRRRYQQTRWPILLRREMPGKPLLPIDIDGFALEYAGRRALARTPPTPYYQYLRHDTYMSHRPRSLAYRTRCSIRHFTDKARS